MQIIAKTDSSNVRFIVGTINDISLRYNTLKSELAKNEMFTLFAEPVSAGNVIVWRTPLKGKIRNFSQLSNVLQNAAKQQLLKSATLINAGLSMSGKLTELLPDYLTVPSNDDIFIVETSEGDKVVLTNWGCISDEADKTSVRIAIGEKFPVPVKFLLTFPDNIPAAGESVYIRYNQISNLNTADENGEIDFGDVTIGSEMICYQVVNDKEKDLLRFVCDGREHYIVPINPAVDLNFVVKYDDGELLPDSKFTFEYEGKTVELVSDAEAKMILPKVPVSAEVKTYKLAGYRQDHLHKFVCEENAGLYEIIIPKDVVPPPAELHSLKIKLIDKKKNPLPGNLIELKNSTLTVQAETNPEGFAEFSELEIKNQSKLDYIVTYGKHKIPWNYRYKSKVFEVTSEKSISKSKIAFNSNVERYDIMLKKRCLWCLLLPLLLLLLLLRINDAVDYKLISTCSPAGIPDTEVLFNYVDYLGDAHNDKDTSDKKGEVSFSVKGRRLYQIIFGLYKAYDPKLTAQVEKSGNVIVSNSDVLSVLEPKLTELVLDTKEEFTITVVSAKQPDFKIADADVDLTYEIDGKAQTFSGKTDSLGNCSFTCPTCIEQISMHAKKHGYYDDSISTLYASAKSKPEERTLNLTPYSYSLDIVMVIDATGSMGSLLSAVTTNATNFYVDLKDAMEKEDKYTEKIRVRTIAYRDYYSDAQPMVASAFFTLPDDSKAYKSELAKIRASGGGDSPESGLEALGFAIKSDWNASGDHLRQIIVFWTDAEAKSLEDPKRKTSSKYPTDMPKDFAELTDMWTARSKTASLVLFAPNISAWSDIKSKWDNLIFMENKGSISRTDYDKAILEIAKEI